MRSRQLDFDEEIAATGKKKIRFKDSEQRRERERGEGQQHRRVAEHKMDETLFYEPLWSLAFAGTELRFNLQQLQ